jgi:parallel beta-helix repeat protein
VPSSVKKHLFESRIRRPKAIESLLVLLLGFSLLVIGAPAVHATAECSPAGSTGLTTLMIAHSDETIKGKTIDATGCDVAIYVPPGSEDVVIKKNDISGAAIHGIFVQDSREITITHNNVHDNSAGVPAVSCDFVHEGPCVNEGKAIQLVGTSDSEVSHNGVHDDLFGGIAITDDGPVDPGALNPGNPNNANNNLVSDNKIFKVSNDCGIVLAVYNQQTAKNNVIRGNDVEGSQPPFGVNPYVGQIVIAGDGPNATIKNTIVSHNTIHGSTLPGLVLHSNAPGDRIKGTVISNNKLGDNGYYPSFFSTLNTPVAANGTTAISLVAEAYPGMPHPPTITDTTLINNTINPDHIGVWLCKTDDTTIQRTPNHKSEVDIPVLVCANGGD